jgi:hypothetical protein
VRLSQYELVLCAVEDVRDVLDQTEQEFEEACGIYRGSLGRIRMGRTHSVVIEKIVAHLETLV